MTNRVYPLGYIRHRALIEQLMANPRTNPSIPAVALLVSALSQMSWIGMRMLIGRSGSNMDWC